MTISHVQLGKNKITERFLETLKGHFKNHENVKISVLKSCCRDKTELKEMAEKLLESLGKNYTSKTVGYAIAIKKWRRIMR